MGSEYFFLASLGIKAFADNDFGPFIDNWYWQSLHVCVSLSQKTMTVKQTVKKNSLFSVL